MSLDDQLRTALNQQADVRYAPPPDVQGLISGGRARRRRRHATRAGFGVMAVVLAVGGVYGARQIDPGRARTESGPAAAATLMTLPSFQNTEFVPIKPGTYRMAVGADASGARIDAALTVRGPGWLSGSQPVLSEVTGAGGGPIMAGVGVYQPTLLAGGSGCTSSSRGRAPGTTALEMARRLIRLPRSEVVQRPTETRAFGHDALHLRLRIDDQCPMDEYYRLAETPSGDRGISYGNQPEVVIIDLWVVDVDGTAVVVDTWRHSDTPTAQLETTRLTRSSIRFETLG
ncbi:hypothetical protein [Nocardioides sp.]|jgi:hypothetical protein|uniref:hypothetical protein n=1 Tax=Nocardioides sp. TaxID=35761 RepID=UPI002F40EA30